MRAHACKSGYILTEIDAASFVHNFWSQMHNDNDSDEEKEKAKLLNDNMPAVDTVAQMDAYN